MNSSIKRTIFNNLSSCHDKPVCGVLHALKCSKAILCSRLIQFIIIFIIINYLKLCVKTMSVLYVLIKTTIQPVHKHYILLPICYFAYIIGSLIVSRFNESNRSDSVCESVQMIRFKDPTLHNNSFANRTSLLVLQQYTVSKYPQRVALTCQRCLISLKISLGARFKWFEFP